MQKIKNSYFLPICLPIFWILVVILFCGWPTRSQLYEIRLRISGTGGQNVLLKSWTFGHRERQSLISLEPSTLSRILSSLSVKVCYQRHKKNPAFSSFSELDGQT